MVSDLIDAQSNKWKIDVVHQNFLSQDVEAILSIPLCASGARDKIVWAEDKNGRFSVRSAYKMAMEDGLDGGRSSCSSQSELRKVWKGLWGMNLPNKVKHFAWKACRNILATKENLCKRKITPNDICDCCGTHTKTVSHLFWFCEHAKTIWSSSKLIIPFEVLPSWDFMEVMCQAQQWSVSLLGLVERTVMVCWGIWKNGNELHHGGKGRTGGAVLRGALLLLEEYQRANVSSEVAGERMSLTVKWNPPAQGRYKVNVDGAMFTKCQQMGIGVIIRNDKGEVIAAMSPVYSDKPQASKPSPLHISNGRGMSQPMYWPNMLIM